MRTTLPGEPPIEMQVRHAPRARRISLRVSSRDGRVTLTLPPGSSMSEAIGFARDREAWLRRVLAQVPPMMRPMVGGRLMLEGRLLPIVSKPGRCVTMAEGELRVPEGRPAGPELAKFLKTVARHRAEAAVEHYSSMVGRTSPPLSLRDTRSRWGSCTAEGNLMISWRLVMAPSEILDYVAAHEVAHLVHLDHSSKFWGLTERLFPGWKAARRWLKDEGARLQSIDFS
jgi:predicted metal-dependent hydrolase